VHVMAATATAERLIRLLEQDPDLGRLLPEAAVEQATRSTFAALHVVAPGPWKLGPRPVRSPFGAVVLDGLLVREVTVSGSVGAELLSAGDTLLPAEIEDAVFIAADVCWTALEPTVLGLLDVRFAAAVRHWPQLGVALLERAERRAARLAITQAIGQLTRVDDRLLALLWHLAERWGRVTPRGVAVPLRLTHRVLARLIGARRPSVTSALTGLQRRGRLERRADGAWVLHGEPPDPVRPPREQRAPWRDSRNGGPSVSRIPIEEVLLAGPSRGAAALASSTELLSETHARHRARVESARRATLELRAESLDLQARARTNRERYAHLRASPAVASARR
jgi:CRP/FNR family cyclic AMP-dependent transcriptional regulator